MIAVPRKMHTHPSRPAYYSCNMLPAVQTIPPRYVLLAPVLVAAVVVTTAAQAPPPQTTTSAMISSASASPSSFEVASIRMVEPHSLEDLKRGIGVGEFNSWPANRFFAHYMPLGVVISMAFNTGHIDGGPDWLGTQLYSIDGKVESERQLSMDEMRPLVQTLLAQRFNLKVHQTSKLVSGYALVVTKGGPKLQPAKEGARPSGMSKSVQAQILPNRLDAWGITIDGLAGILAGPAGAAVIDKTGLTGSYDITLKYAPESDPNSSLPSIFTAIQEQLGLKLEPAKVPVGYLVIDHVDRVPAEN